MSKQYKPKYRTLVANGTKFSIPRYTGIGDPIKDLILYLAPLWKYTGITWLLNHWFPLFPKPCLSCNRRRSLLNQLIPFIPRGSNEFILWNLSLIRDQSPDTIDERSYTRNINGTLYLTLPDYEASLLGIPLYPTFDVNEEGELEPINENN